MSSAMVLWLAGSYLANQFMLGLLALLATPSVFVSGIDLPSERGPRRLLVTVTLLGLTALGFGLLHEWQAWSLVPAFFIAAVLFGSLAAWGELWGRSSLAILVMAAMSQVGVGVVEAWQFAFAVVLSSLWISIYSGWWFRLQGDYPLRLALANCYRRLGSILASRMRWIENPELGREFDLVLGEQLWLVRRYVEVAKARGSLSNELNLAFMAVVDLQERLQAIPNPELSRKLFAEPMVLPAYKEWVKLTSRRLAQIADELITLTPIRSTHELDLGVGRLEAALQSLERSQFKQIVPYFIANAQRISRLASRAAPLYQREMSLSEPEPQWWSQWKMHFKWSSPIFRGAVRQGVLVSFTMGLMLVLELDKAYWALFSVLMVVRGGIVDTRQRAWQRIWGTFIGLALAALLLMLGVEQNLALVLALLLLPPTLSLIPVHHGYACILGTMILIMVFEYIGGLGLDVIPLRFFETVIGCVVVLLGYRYLWPQWQGGRQAQLRQQAVSSLNGYLKLILDSFYGNEVPKLELARARRFTYEQGVALTSSYEQMRQEPNYSQHKDSVELIRVYKEIQSHLNALLPVVHRSVVLTEAQSQLVDEAVWGAAKAVEQEMTLLSPQWPESLESARQALYVELEQEQPRRRGFVLYQLSMVLERYQHLHTIATSPAPSASD
ncbi:FUSC family protein [Ferrimonas aestuarii]|uniref:FUSC family protein n=1 Tax=Ferrimonas aestuarii TaxID=2569539 RepID=UPI00145E5BC3|nr:FUSC family protein [Ferrimonas aestuarii]